MSNSDLKYLSGFGNQFESEALSGALPREQNSPQSVPFGLYAEQLSGTAFTAPRHSNSKVWLYRIRPSVVHETFLLIDGKNWKGAPYSNSPASPNQYRWDPVSELTSPTDFVDGIMTIAGNGSHAARNGCAVGLYSLNAPMTDRYFYNSDAEMMVLPQSGELVINTECGVLHVKPTELVVIPHGMKFQVAPVNGKSSGYVCENFGAAFRLPDLGPIGANGLANARHFLSPVAKYEDKTGKFRITTKYEGNLWETTTDRSPLDVVAWAGNLVPYKYDLNLFNTINSVSFDHPDPSIFTVLTSPSAIAGTANIDFVIFPPRWMVAEHTFRPPYYHRNTMSEFMGLIKGVYDAKQGGFVPGGSSLHNRMSAHGPDNATFEGASRAELKPQRYEDTLAFMWESSLAFHPTDFAMGTNLLQKDYLKCWQGLKKHFNPKDIHTKV